MEVQGMGEIKFIKSYTGQEIVEIDDRQRPEGIRHIEEYCYSSFTLSFTALPRISQ